MRLCSYIVMHDIGLAPNPFWGYCTLAVCSPNHMGLKMQKGDWIVGFSSKPRGNKLVYAMHVDEVLRFDEYFKESRFEKKKPVVTGTWKEKCGDNFYYKDHNDNWIKYPSLHHQEQEVIERDLKHPYVFLAEEFYYFGENAEIIPSEFQHLIYDHRGCKCDHDPQVVEGFIGWLKKNYRPGIHGKPKDRDVECEENC